MKSTQIHMVTENILCIFIFEFWQNIKMLLSTDGVAKQFLWVSTKFFHIWFQLMFLLCLYFCKSTAI